jgi:cyclase
MPLDRRRFLKGSLTGVAGLGSLPLLGSLAGCQTMAPAGSAAAAPAGAKMLPAKALPLGKISDRISVISGAPGNVTVLAAADGAMLVDSGARELAASVQKTLAGAHVHTLFNTHYHPDQTGGNALFGKAGAVIHAQTITKEWLAADYYVPEEDRWVRKPPPEAVPTVTFRKKGEMTVGPESIEFGYLLEAHTRGDAYVYFRDSNVLATGCVVSPVRDPSIDWYAGAWLGGRADAMDALVAVANEQTRVVPAYGPVMSYAELKAEADLMKRLYDLTADLVHHGHSAEDMMNDHVLDKVDRKFQDPFKFLYDVAKAFQAHYTNFGGNVV